MICGIFSGLIVGKRSDAVCAVLWRPQPQRIRNGSQILWMLCELCRGLRNVLYMWYISVCACAKSTPRPTINITRDNLRIISIANVTQFQSKREKKKHEICNMNELSMWPSLCSVPLNWKKRLVRFTHRFRSPNKYSLIIDKCRRICIPSWSMQNVCCVYTGCKCVCVQV